MKKRIVFVNQSSGYLMIDIINAFEKKYDERVIIVGNIRSRSRKLDETVRIHKVKAYNNATKLKRLITWSIAFIQMLFLIIIRYRDADLFLVTNPPFTAFIPLFCKNPFSILVYDIYPNAIAASGLLKMESFPVRLWTKVNKNVFKRAKKIFTISDGMKKEIKAYADESKIEVIPLWIDDEKVMPINKRNNVFIKEQKLQEKFVVLYSGNLGFTHDVEVVIDIAERFIDYNEIYFLIIGKGEKRDMLESRIKNKKLKNCRLLPWQSAEMLPYTISSADIAVVTLSSFASTLSVPSKTFNYLSVGAPLLCVAEKSSELATLVNRYKVGHCFRRDEVDDMVKYIMEVKNDPVYYRRLQRNALDASKEFVKINAIRFSDALS
ncbi:MAG: glycosyltransferase family 4 protein [Planctomycetes bacterium]|nr:glycosyltransferase family 4 protein [Planctomycetota bacterium]